MVNLVQVWRLDGRVVARIPSLVLFYFCDSQSLREVGEGSFEELEKRVLKNWGFFEPTAWQGALSVQ